MRNPATPSITRRCGSRRHYVVVLWPGVGGFGAGLLAVQRKDPPGPMPLAGHSTFLVVPIT